MSDTMIGTAVDGGFGDPPRDAARAFRAALQALSRPGTLHEIAGAVPPAPCSVAAGALLLTLCDAETGLYLAPSLDTPELRDWVAFHTGAPIVEAGVADFALGTWTDLAPLDRFKVGTQSYPDRAATLIVEMDAIAQSGSRLTGPGIADAAYLTLPEVAAFQANRRKFPLGFDTYFTCGSQVAGLPRSTRVEDL